MTNIASRPIVLLAFVAAILHVAALALGGLSVNVTIAVGGTLIWALLGYGLLSGRRIMQYLTFVLSLAGVSAAIIAALSAYTVPSVWAWYGVLVVDLAILGAMFAALWRGPTAA